MLKKNTRNRRVCEASVARYKDDMLSGAWKLTGDSIKFSRTNALLDGQHRLLSIVAADKPVKMLVVTGLDEDIFDCLDVGKKRNIGDVLSIRGHKNVVTLGSALHYLHRYLSGSIAKESSGTTSAPHSELERLLEQYPGILDSVQLSIAHRNRLVSNSLLAAMHFLMTSLDKSLADQLIIGISKGFNSSEFPNFYLFREFLIKNSINRSKLSPSYICAVMIKVWNATREGREIKQIKFGAEEKFPLLK